MAQMCKDFVSDTKPIVWQTTSHSFSKTDVICPQPVRVPRIPNFLEGLNKVSPMPKSILAKQRGGSGFEILNNRPDQDDLESDSDCVNWKGFLCGSPPVRSHNPLVHDVQFTKQTQSFASPLGNSSGSPTPSTAVEKGSPSCFISGSPKVRIEGFSCSKSDTHCVVPALA
ncbi:hypothetical protein AXF42_Ash002164 [Apostasia shenzhenica]|uniref:Uncharacterized protein n=1 Tax=Apostasia shenzhenica TaxID=1088818 RepID=A0A2I0AMT5_9ASPA|nr:hypothetical protein AXF42_Ash002164 [Apostasia shenzhenica]